MKKAYKEEFQKWKANKRKTRFSHLLAQPDEENKILEGLKKQQNESQKEPNQEDDELILLPVIDFFSFSIIPSLRRSNPKEGNARMWI